MEIVTSRKNNYIKHLRELAASTSARNKAGEYVCGGMKLLREALASGAAITSALWAGEPEMELVGAEIRSCPIELLEYVSPLSSPQSPVFTVRMPGDKELTNCKRAIILDGIQNPGNAGTIIRTAAAFFYDIVILAPGCADRYAPKTVHGAMGALFKIPVLAMNYGEIREFLASHSLMLYGAELAPEALDVRELPKKRVAVAIGNEGAGLGPEVRSMLCGSFKIPIADGVESLNAAVAAGVTMWEMTRQSTVDNYYSRDDAKRG